MAQINKPSDYFNTVLYTGTGSGGSNRQITGVGFQPDFTWVKTRGSSQEHVLSDSVRGATKALDSQATTAEETTNTRIGAFISDGFQLGSGAVQNRVNQSGIGIASWNWLANGAGVANTDGSISSTVSASATSGFSIVSYTGTNATATVGHGLGVTPKVVIYKNRTDVTNWYFTTTIIDGTHDLLFLNTNEAQQVYSAPVPTSSVLNLIANNDTNGSGDNIIAYCFAEKKGFSKFGSFVSNNTSDNAFIYTGFKPAFLIAKSTTSTNNWVMFDNKRNTFNAVDKKLYPDLSNSEDTEADWDFLSNGLKLRAGYGANTYIYMAFAENPLVGTNNIPTTAR